MNCLSEQIRTFRAAKGWSQRDLAKEMGVSQQTIAHWESGGMPRGNKIDALLEMLDDIEILECGDIVQVQPGREVFGACMVVVTEVASWGIQGYVQSAGIEGQHFIRLKFGDFETTGGKAVWVVQ